LSAKNASRLKVIAILVGVFLLGGGVGGALMHMHGLRSMRHTMGGPPTKARARFRLQAMTRHLDLDDDQRTKIEAILREGEQERERLMVDVRPELDKLRQSMNSRINAVLTPEQQAKHKVMLERLRKRRNRRRGKRRRGPRGKRHRKWRHEGKAPRRPPPDPPPPASTFQGRVTW